MKSHYFAKKKNRIGERSGTMVYFTKEKIIWGTLWNLYESVNTPCNTTWYVIALKQASPWKNKNVICKRNVRVRFAQRAHWAISLSTFISCARYSGLCICQLPLLRTQCTCLVLWITQPRNFGFQIDVQNSCWKLNFNINFKGNGFLKFQFELAALYKGKISTLKPCTQTENR